MHFDRRRNFVDTWSSDGKQGVDTRTHDLVIHSNVLIRVCLSNLVLTLANAKRRKCHSKCRSARAHSKCMISPQFTGERPFKLFYFKAIIAFFIEALPKKNSAVRKNI